MSVKKERTDQDPSVGRLLGGTVSDELRKLRLAVEHSPATVVITDAEGSIQYVNPKFTELTGYTAEETLGKNPSILSSGKHPPEFYRDMWETIKQGKEWRGEFCNLKKGGEPYWESASISVVRDEQGIITHYVAVKEDITQRKRDEEALRLSESSLAEAQRIARLGNWDWDIRADSLFWSDEIYRIFGLKPQEFGATYEAFLQSVHPEDRELVKEAVNRALRANEPYSIDHRIVQPQGTIRIVHEQAEVFHDPSGLAVRMVGTVQDVTTQKQNERDREERLRFERLLSDLSAMFVNIPVKQVDAQIMVGLKKTGEFLGVDRVTLFEFSNDMSELEPISSFAFSGFEPYRSSDLPQSAPWVIARISRGEEVVLTRIPDDLPPEATKDRISFQSSGLSSIAFIPILVEGRVEFAVSLSSFRTERHLPAELLNRLRLLGEIFTNALLRKRATIEARALGEELSYVTRITTMGELAGALAHEINQPLAAILSNAQAARRFLAAGEPDMEELADILKDIAEDTERASSVIKNLRSMMKKEEREFVSLNIQDVIREVVSLVKRDPVGHRGEISLGLEDGLPAVLGDRVQLQQVLMNLIQNGFEAMMYQKEGAGELVIRSLRQDERYIRVEVHDAGIGIEDSRLERIFDPFFTTKAEGMGIGLSVNRTIIEAHGGRLWAQNNPEYGMTFSFILPVSEGDHR
jgi:PAS domain S-box-containing protein